MEASFQLAEERAREYTVTRCISSSYRIYDFFYWNAGQVAEAASEAARRMQPSTPAAQNTTQNVTSIADKTVSGDATFALSEAENTPGPISNLKPKKKKVKPKMTAKEKRERGVRFFLLGVL